MQPMSVDNQDSHGYGPAPDDPVTFDATEENYGRGRLVLVLAIVMAVAAVGIIFAVYEQGARSRNEPVTITAEKGPEKVAPDEPGGAVIEHQDKYVYDQISGTEEPQVEVLMPKAEEPMDLSGLRTVNSSDAVVDSASETTSSKEETSPTPAPTPKPKVEETAKTQDYVGALIEETSTGPDESVVASQSAASGAYVVQVGAYDQSSLAATAWDKMSRKHSALLSQLRPDIQVADLGDKGTWYRLRVGPFADKASADRLCANLKAAGQDCLVRKP